MTDKYVRIRWDRIHAQVTLDADEALRLFGTSDEEKIARLAGSDLNFAEIWERGGEFRRGSLVISSVRTISEPEISEDGEGQFSIHDDDDPPSVRRGPYPSRQAAREDWKADYGYAASASSALAGLPKMRRN
jgi:hypothetical protein